MSFAVKLLFNLFSINTITWGCNDFFSRTKHDLKFKFVYSAEQWMKTDNQRVGESDIR